MIELLALAWDRCSISHSQDALSADLCVNRHQFGNVTVLPTAVSGSLSNIAVVTPLTASLVLYPVIAGAGAKQVIRDLQHLPIKPPNPPIIFGLVWVNINHELGNISYARSTP